MALSANLFLRQNQSLVMTPQLMQSIQLLQMTHFELVQFIAQEVEKNPLLEFAPNDEGTGSSDPGTDSEAPPAPAPSDTLQSDWYEHGGDGDLNERLDANFGTAFSDDGANPKTDAPEMLGQWKSMPGAQGDGEGYDLDDFVAGKVSLRDHLGQQLPFVLSSASDRMIALALIDQLDEAGYLRADLDEVAIQMGASRDDMERILAALQTMEPAGLFARNLGECLAIQLRQRDRLDPAMAALIGNLDYLAKRDFASLKRLCGVDEEDLLDMLAEIRKLNPKPGAGFETDALETVVPDILVAPSLEGGWLVELNAETLPRVLVNNAYFTEIRRSSLREGAMKTANGQNGNGKTGQSKAEGEQAFLTDCLQTANWLTRSLDQRAKTIMKVATEIIRQQDAFLRHGVDHLRPLNLKTVADAIKMHESTVSRVTSNKYMLTPRGLFELKYFFSVSIGSAEGGDSHSAEAVRHRIRMLIAQESPENILSDDDIVESLKNGGVELARRTVAKYREAMNIASSVQRRREKRALARNPG
ncbi:RNA polymerase factor sigma-54 [Agrobacterium vitis]|uniref:RNA polymerase factor sigma-54 n=1 Tax=Rhizobium/Agrobacterium group TaxID=227290 RepID=UPI0008DBFD1A|nr:MULTISPECIES: RNA polymerase factor sigma-54 [Rhizobium/Agrobacterium group]MCF1435575.1 RNA polymerase factor sigma-54 [Allorhizobium ampelinum]MUO88653.1 RNA polymerase factor sigma-54 [Agrobacterium vitis]MUZ52184.1 RNA polymerase factor sigma-54 [Agrobacterium vitis]MUZ91767.1 RNA polymerase factor sigma-54 [Agrobacterium vitis]MVA39856.1 RNA polymerase factor sigma-54 [Agrobacterium vitis]